MELHAAGLFYLPSSLMHFCHLKVVQEVDQKVVILSGCHQVGEIWRDDDVGRSELGEKLL